MGGNGQQELFDETDGGENRFVNFTEADIALIAALHSSTTRPDLAALPPNARRLYELSIDAFTSITYARMSELPLATEIALYEQKILAASTAVVAEAATATAGEAERKAADAAATDRGDADVRAVLDAAYKVWHEIHRLMGLLRFYPNKNGVYIAHCEPDHFILPALGPHFQERFGETPWSIIDEKRRLCLYCTPGKQPALLGMDECPTDTLSALTQDQRGEWENLWRNYHKTINNESRYNPGLQRQFMPRRYWKYVTELRE